MKILRGLSQQVSSSKFPVISFVISIFLIIPLVYSISILMQFTDSYGLCPFCPLSVEANINQTISQKIENIFSANHELLKKTLVEATQENIF